MERISRSVSAFIRGISPKSAFYAASSEYHRAKHLAGDASICNNYRQARTVISSAGIIKALRFVPKIVKPTRPLARVNPARERVS